ncbi:MAG: extracellular solute-binding protein [Clostridiales bacterium]|jgi:arabinogalactan oligomer/maltooligosaccharide transport system substrate-binding protein|nr:extracellular solute-binding protein [Clostridiales bacterium]
MRERKKKMGTGAKMARRALALAMCALLPLAAFAACGAPGGSRPTSDGSVPGGSAGEPGGENVSLRVWGPQEEQGLLKEMCEAFAAANPANTYAFEYGVVAEGDARTRYSEDPAAAADVFMFSNDHLRDLVGAQSLYEITRNKDDIVSRNVQSSVEAASVDDRLYGYPMTADNGYFMYYDKSVFSEEDAKSLDQMLKVANEQGKKVYFDAPNGWYLVSFFFAAGCTIDIDGGKQVCDFNSAGGLAAAEAIKAFTADPAYVGGDGTVLAGGMGSSIAAGVSGIWDAKAMQERLGDNYAATKLPTATIGGEQKQLGSFGGYKLVGVNSLTKAPVHAMDLADWLTNEQNQLTRYEKREYGPSNANAAESGAVKANAALSALALQRPFALPQNDVLSSFWTPVEAFGRTMDSKDYSKPLQELLDSMVAQITA